MTGLDPRQFREAIVDPTLLRLGLHSEAAAVLVLGTAIQESRLRFLRQLKRGPALGVYQMEPATYYDILTNWLAFRPELKERVQSLLAPGLNPLEQLVGNLQYATALCRVHYTRAREALPEPDDLEGMGRYWKEHYNTPAGRGTATEFVFNFKRAAILGGAS